MNQPVPDELISAYFDGEVTPEERGRVEHLLESSTDFRQFLDDTSKLSALLHSFPRETPSAELAENVQRRVGALPIAIPVSPGPQRRSLRREWTAFGAGIMATMASLVCFYVALNQSGNVDHTGGVADSRPFSDTSDARSFAAPERYAAKQQKAVAVQNSEEQKPELKSVDASAKSEAAHLAMNALKDSSADRDKQGVDGAGLSELSSSASRERASQLRNGLMNSANEVTILESPEPAEFFEGLEKGDVFHRRDAVAVVEFTVVDIYKGAAEMQFLLQQRKLEDVENFDASSSKERDRKAVDFSQRSLKRERAASPDDLLVFFVRGPGTELAETMKSSLEQHPDIYKKFTAHLPIQLSANVAVDSSNGIASSSATDISNSPRALGDQDSAIEQQTVADEANLAVNLLATRNGMTIDDSQVAEGQQRRKSAAVAGSAVMKEKSEGDAVRSKADGANMAAKKAGPSAANVAEKQTQAAANSSGYAMFQLAQNGQRQEGRQQLAQRPNSAQMAPGGPIVTQQNPLNPQQNSLFANNGTNFVHSTQPGQAYKPRNRGSNSDNREPPIVRMLIVLKTEQPAAAPSP